jgi:hypothetical protein
MGKERLGMRKVLIAAAAVLLLLAGGGYAAIHFGKNMIADRVMDEVIAQVLQDEEVRRLLDDPEISRALREAVTEEDLERLRGEIGARLDGGGAGGVPGDGSGSTGGSGGPDAGAVDSGGGNGVHGPASGSGSLPIRTVEEAEALVLEKFSLAEIRRYAALLKGGLTEEEMRLIRDEALSRFTEEEWRALQTIALIEAERRAGN